MARLVQCDSEVYVGVVSARVVASVGQSANCPLVYR